MIMGQVHVDGSVRLTAADEALRQVTGLSDAVLPGDGINVASYRSGHFAVASVEGAIWQVTMPGMGAPPTLGASFTILSPGVSSGPVSLNLNGSGPYPLRVGPDSILDWATVATGSILALTFDGSGFQVMNHRTRGPRPCPPGMIEVNSEFCMDVLPSTTTSDFFDSAIACGQRGLRLCSWAEFTVGCELRSVLGITILGQYEWVGSSCNENGNARVSGLSSCTSTGCTPATGGVGRVHRCCTER